MAELQIGPLALAYLSHHPKDAAQVLSGGDAKSIVALLGQSMAVLRPDQVAEVLTALPSPMGSESLALLPLETAAALLPTLSMEAVAEIVAPLLGETTKRLLSTLRPAQLAGVRRILNYAPDSVGKIMHTDALTLPYGISVAAARSMLPSGRMDTPAVAFVLDTEHRVKGMVSFQALATAKGDTELETLIRPAPPALKTKQHLAEVHLLPVWQEHHYLPVIGTHGRFLGVLQRTDVLEARIDGDASLAESDRDPIDLLLSIAETVWVPLAYLFGKAAYPRQPDYSSEKGEK